MDPYGHDRRNKYDSPETKRNFLNVISLLIILFAVLGYVIYWIRS